MSRATQPGALRRLAVAALLAATVGVVHAPVASAVTDDGTTSASAADTRGADDDAAAAEARRADEEHAADRRDGTRAADTHDEDGTAGTAGDTDEPQPLSPADDNDGGANGDCPEGEYCSTRDGESSENGAGDGDASGRPCAGCVGKADNKNPPGQAPNADEDGDRGYECDDNQGVGQGNPAHTGCVSVDDSDGGTAGGGTADGGDVAGEDAIVESGAESGADVAGADAEVAGVEAFAARPGQGSGTAAVPASAGPMAAILPATGSGVLVGLAAVAGLLMLGAGTVLLRRRAHG